MKSLIEKDSRYIWHPYTQMKDHESCPPILIKRAKGIRLYDDRGRFYYDTISSWWCNVHGHNHPDIKKAITKQLNYLDHVLFAGFTHKPAILLAEKLVSIAPKGIKKVFFVDNGSTAVEAALKLSFQYWQNLAKKQKTGFVSLDRAYHGDTIGAMSVSGVGLFNDVFSPLSFKAHKIPSPYCYRCPAGKRRPSCSIECINRLESLLRMNADTIAALILEPMVLAAGGMIIYPAQYLKKARELTRKYNVHLILDEVATGFGRTGKMFASEHADIEPDITCLSKGITSGTLPMGVAMTTDEIYDAFYDDYEKQKTFYHGHTYTANPISCSAAVASLDIFEKEATLDRLKALIPILHKGTQAFRALKLVGDIRHIGMIAAIELIKDKKKKTPFPIKERIGLKAYREGLKRNILLRPLGDVIYLYPPLCIKEAELRVILERAFSAIEGITKPVTEL